jgi:hypothetical protein
MSSIICNRNGVIEVSLGSTSRRDGAGPKENSLNSNAARRVTRPYGEAVQSNVQFQFDGRAFMPAGFMMAAGNTFGVSRYAHLLMLKIADFEQSFASDPGRLSADFEKHGLALPDPPEFEFAIIADKAGIIETKSRAWMKLVPQQS